MSADKYPSIFWRQMEPIVYIIDSGSTVLVGDIPTQFSQNTALHSSLIIFNRHVQPLLL